MLALEQLNETTTTINFKALQQHLETVLHRLGLADRLKLELVVVGDKKITELNRQFLQHNYPTDVLSFPDGATAQEPGSERSLGSIVISAETAERQADQAGIPIETEIKTLTTHGLLHLLGYHHQ